VITACGAGLLAGLLHVFAGADHLAALTPLSLQAGRRAWRVGVRWGLGHSSGVLAVAALAFGLRQVVHLQSIRSWGERLVGGSLILLGLWGLRGLLRDRLHAHAHRHGGEDHVHVHVHSPAEAHDAPEAHVHGHAAFWVGTLHGLAGTAHLLGILPSLALPSAAETAGYLVSFAAGTIAAMTAFSSGIGALASSRTEGGLRFYRWMLGAASGLCALVGAAWILLPLWGIDLP
jgi:hypothetical protein